MEGMKDYAGCWSSGGADAQAVDEIFLCARKTGNGFTFETESFWW